MNVLPIEEENLDDLDLDLLEVKSDSETQENTMSEEDDTPKLGKNSKY